jgi:hypothetical protein
MDDLPPSTTPRFWIAFTILCVAFVVAFFMAATTQANAQQMLCAPADAFIKQMVEVKKQMPVWEGVIPVEGQPPAEALIMQSETEWSLFFIQEGRACLVAAGTDANPPLKPQDPEI